MIFSSYGFQAVLNFNVNYSKCVKILKQYVEPQLFVLAVSLAVQPNTTMFHCTTWFYISWLVVCYFTLCVCTYIFMYTHMYICIHTHIYIYISIPLSPQERMTKYKQPQHLTSMCFWLCNFQQVQSSNTLCYASVISLPPEVSFMSDLSSDPSFPQPSSWLYLV